MLVIVLAGILVLVLIIVYFLQNQKKEIPKTIWTYWNDDSIPEFIQKCIDTWRRENPGYEINIITDTNLERYVGWKEARDLKESPLNESPQRMSDLVRLSVLKKHGGIWLDASIICYESLEWVHAEDESKCIVYSIPELAATPLIESWFIACSPEHPFITQWYEEFKNTANFSSVQEYIDAYDIEMTGINYPDYLLIYVCARKVYKDQPQNLLVLNASTGPYVYHTRGGVGSLCQGRPPRFMKLRKEDRAALQELGDDIKKCAFDKNTPTA